MSWMKEHQFMAFVPKRKIVIWMKEHQSMALMLETNTAYGPYFSISPVF